MLQVVRLDLIAKVICWELGGDESAVVFRLNNRNRSLPTEQFAVNELPGSNAVERLVRELRTTQIRLLSPGLDSTGRRSDTSESDLQQLHHEQDRRHVPNVPAERSLGILRKFDLDFLQEPQNLGLSLDHLGD